MLTTSNDWNMPNSIAGGSIFPSSARPANSGKLAAQLIMARKMGEMRQLRA